jgi:Ca2+-binding RTX toxin-like protein
VARGAGNDTLKIDKADLTLNGGKGFIDGGTGNNRLLVEDDSILLDDPGVSLKNYAQYHTQFVRGSRGSDIIDFSNATPDLTLRGWDSNDVLKGGVGNDVLTGDQGNDTLLGGRGNDTLIGGDGNDALHGGTGTNLMQGGTGNDLYIFNTSVTLASNNTLQDSAGTLDKLESEAGRSVALFRNGNDLLIGYKGQSSVTRIEGQFSGNAVEAIGNVKGLAALDAIATTTGDTAALAAATGGKFGTGAFLLSYAEINTITAHIAGMAAITSLADVQNNDSLLKYIASFG